MSRQVVNLENIRIGMPGSIARREAEITYLAKLALEWVSKAGQFGPDMESSRLMCLQTAEEILKTPLTPLSSAYKG